MINDSCKEFLDKLFSSSPVPGGGGASAMVGAMGVALGGMVANLTLGKTKYSGVQEDIERVILSAERLQNELINLVEKDAKAFEPLSKAYGLPKGTEEERKIKEETLENALKEASIVPFQIMENALEAMLLHDELAEIGTKIAISDVGVGVLFCKSALQGASLNIFINTKLMKDRKYAEELNTKVEQLLMKGTLKADSIYQKVEVSLK